MLVDVAIEAEVSPIYSAASWRPGLLAAVTGPWHSILALRPETTHVAFHANNPVYRDGWDDHMIHVPTFAERMQNEMATNPLFGAFG